MHVCVPCIVYARILQFQYGFCLFVCFEHNSVYINPLQPIVPKVNLLLLDDKCNFWDHFEMAIFLLLHLLHAF